MEYAAQILTAITQDYLRLLQFTELRAEIEGGGVVSKFHGPIAKELRTLVVEHVIAQLIKQCTKSGLKEESSPLQEREKTCIL